MTIVLFFSLAAVTSGLLTIVKTGITIVGYFGNVTASLFALTIVRENLRLGDPKQYRLTIVRYPSSVRSPVNLGILEAQHQTNCNRIVFNAI